MMVIIKHVYNNYIYAFHQTFYFYNLDGMIDFMVKLQLRFGYGLKIQKQI